MTASSAPFGFTPDYHGTGGTLRPRAIPLGIASGYNTQILIGQPVKMVTAGTIQAAAASDAIIGVFAGCEYVPGASQYQRPQGGYWPANQTYDTAQPMYAYVWDDPNIIYRVQCDGSLAQTSLFDEADSSNNTAGSTVTGNSASTLSATLKGVGVQGQWRIMGLALYEGNAWGDAFTIAQVRVANHQYGGVQTAL